MASSNQTGSEVLASFQPLGFYQQTIERFAEIGGRRLSECADPHVGVELTSEECEKALQGNPPPGHCRKEVSALHHRWIVTVERNIVRVTIAAMDSFDPEI